MRYPGDEQMAVRSRLGAAELVVRAARMVAECERGGCAYCRAALLVVLDDFDRAAAPAVAASAPVPAY
jgi:hypothetical protein